MRRAETVGVQLRAIRAVARQYGVLFLNISMYSTFGTERSPFFSGAGDKARKHVDRGISRAVQHRQHSATVACSSQTPQAYACHAAHELTAAAS